MRELGYNVADATETRSQFTKIWADYIEGKVTIEDVVREYKILGYQANQDLPGNFLAYELFKASPDAEVILFEFENRFISGLS